MQYDVPNAFLNATLDRTLHVRTPDGFQDRYGQTLRLLRALYGLEEAPRLWTIHFQESLRKLGLRPVQCFPCLWMNDRIILFFYVDDIIILYHPDYQEDFDNSTASRPTAFLRTSPHNTQSSTPSNQSSMSLSLDLIGYFSITYLSCLIGFFSKSLRLACKYT
jgi:hypothetical protein